MAKQLSLLEQMAEQKRLMEEHSKAFADLQVKAKAEAKDALEKYAQEQFGMSVAEIMGTGGRGSKTKGTTAAKTHRSPLSGVEWSGRSQPPKAYRDELNFEVISARDQPLKYKLGKNILDQGGLLDLLAEKGYKIQESIKAEKPKRNAFKAAGAEA